MMTGRTHVDVVEAKREAREADKEIQVSLREQMLVETIQELHTQHVREINPRALYCQLTSRPGLLKTPELAYIEEHNCPVCSKPPKGITSPAQRVLDGLEKSPEKTAPVPPVPNAGPVITLADERADVGGSLYTTPPASLLR